MKYFYRSAPCAAAIMMFLLLPLAHADGIRTDYNHHMDFSDYHTYSWGPVKTKDPFAADRIKLAVNILLRQRGWQEKPSGGDVTVFATQNIHTQKEAETYYDGLGGGWGMGWGWGGWGWGLDGGFGPYTTRTYNQRVYRMVIDMFNSHSKQLLWRGVARGDRSNNANADRKRLFRDIHEMFDNFPVKPDKKGH